MAATLVGARANDNIHFDVMKLRCLLHTLLMSDDDVRFYDGPGMLIRKTAKLCINSTCIVLLRHGFVLVKTWRLIMCNTVHAL